MKRRRREDPRRKPKATKKLSKIATPRHKVGDIVDLSLIDESIGLESVPLSASRPRCRVTGTEEILGSLDIPQRSADNVDSASSVDKPKLKKQKLSTPKQKKQPSRPRRSLRLQAESSDDEEANVVPTRDSYDKVWRREPQPRPNQLPDDQSSPVEVVSHFAPYPAIPFPRPQAAHCLNKFVSPKLKLREPELHVSPQRRQFTFASSSVASLLGGTAECSKIAGKALSEIFNSTHESGPKLFSMQLPNSLRIFNHRNALTMTDVDIRLRNQGKRGATTHVFESTNVQGTSTIPKRQNVHVLDGFSPDKPFGKLQILKSGKTVLKVGTRIFDVTMSSKNHDAEIGAVVKLNTPGNSKTKSSLLSLGNVTNHFSAFYNYSDIIDNLPPEMLTNPNNDKPVIEEVDLTLNTTA